MARETPGARRRELAQIHLAKKALGLDEGSYRACLERIAGKRSAADLDGPQRRRVIRHFVSLGWRPSRPRTEPHGAPAQRRKIARMCEEQGVGIEYAEGIARQMFSKPLQFCSPRELRAVITALARRGHLRRSAARGPGAGA